MSEFSRADATELIKAKGLSYREEPFRLANGWSHWYCDVKCAVAHGRDLGNVARLITKVAHNELGVTFTHVGGPTMGADPFANAVSLHVGCGSFSIRKEVDEELAAQHTPPASPPRFPPGTPQEYFWIEGHPPGEGDAVLWMEDAISTGGSVMQAMQRFNGHPVARQAQIVGAIAVVDRGDAGTQLFEELGIPYAALVTYHDLGIPRLGES